MTREEAPPNRSVLKGKNLSLQVAPQCSLISRSVCEQRRFAFRHHTLTIIAPYHQRPTDHMANTRMLVALPHLEPPPFNSKSTKQYHLWQNIQSSTSLYEFSNPICLPPGRTVIRNITREALAANRNANASATAVLQPHNEQVYRIASRESQNPLLPYSA